jgi:hypothetical protein
VVASRQLHILRQSDPMWGRGGDESRGDFILALNFWWNRKTFVWIRGERFRLRFFCSDKSNVSRPDISSPICKIASTDSTPEFDELETLKKRKTRMVRTSFQWLQMKAWSCFILKQGYFAAPTPQYVSKRQTYSKFKALVIPTKWEN